MANSSRRNVIIVVLLVLLVLILLLLARCRQPGPVADNPAAAPAPAATGPTPAVSAPAAKEPDEVLTPATVQAPLQVGAGALFPVAWTGPDNSGDLVTIVRKAAPAGATGSYLKTRGGRSLELTAPIEPGDYEVRYVTGRSQTILGRAPVTVTPLAASLDAAAEVTAGTTLSVKWTGPNNAGDLITIAAKGKPDGQYGNYTYTAKGSPLPVLVPITPGDAELRYMTGQGGKVLVRRPLTIITAEVSLSAPTDAIAGSSVSVTWTGPNNPGDFIAVAAKEKPDGQYGNYTYTTKGSPMAVLVPIMAGEAELRYMTGQGGKVLARRPFTVVAAEISLAAPAEGTAGSAIAVTWTGPANPGDFITVVPRANPDSQYGNYTLTNKGSPLTVVAPKEAGDAEVRYMSGQGSKVLARRTIRITR